MESKSKVETYEMICSCLVKNPMIGILKRLMSKIIMTEHEVATAPYLKTFL